MKIRCIVIDDEPPALDLICEYVSRTPFLQLTGKSNSALKAVEKIEVWQPDLIFLDIEMADLSGIQFSKMIPENIKVIFTTAYGEYAIEGYKVEAVDYLLKPISYEEFLSASKKGMEIIQLKRKSAGENSNRHYLFVNSGYKLIKINFDDILYVEGLKDYVKFHLKSSKKPVLSLMSLKQLEKELPTSSFMRVHRSFIINLESIQMVERKRVFFEKGEVRISDSYHEEFLNRIGNFG